MYRWITIFCIVGFFAGCGLKPEIEEEPGKSVPAGDSKLKQRAFIIDCTNWDSSNRESLLYSAIESIERATQNAFDAVIFNIGGLSDFTSYGNDASSPKNPLTTVIEKARRRNLRVYISMTLLQYREDSISVTNKGVAIPDEWLLRNGNGPLTYNGMHCLNPALPSVRSHLKDTVRGLVSNYEIDGIQFNNIPVTLAEFVSDNNIGNYNVPVSDNRARHAVFDCLEDILAEALLIKPYMSISVPAMEMLTLDDISENSTKDTLWNILKVLHTGDLELDIVYGNGETKEARLSRLDARQIVSLKFSAFTPDRGPWKPVYETDTDTWHAPDSEGFVGMILPELPDTLAIECDEYKIPLSTRRWATPYKYTVLGDSTVSREGPWIEIRRGPSGTTNMPEFHLLAKAEYPARTFINGSEIKQYSTGIFFDKVNLYEGPNRVKAESIFPDGSTALYEREIVYEKRDMSRKPYPLWIDERSMQPAADHILLPEDSVILRFNGSKEQIGYALIKPGRLKIPCMREDFEDYSRYSTELPLSRLKEGKKYSITFELVSSGDSGNKGRIRAKADGGIEVRNLAEFPLVRTAKAGSILNYNLGQVRLGGPIIAEYDPGVVLKVSGLIGDSYRIRLDDIQSGFINTARVETLSKETVTPSYYTGFVSTAPSDSADIVRMPYYQPVPYAVYPEPDQNRIIVTLYGVKTNSTWVTHRSNLKQIEHVTWKQTTPETYQVIIHLKTSKIWGYDLRPEGSGLVFSLKYPPETGDGDEAFPLEGLKVAIEAGHGGRSLGAVGLSGLFEKDVNLDVAYKLEDLLAQKGAEVLQVRDTDRSMSITTKRDTVRYSDADLLVSLHANAGGSRGGYLRVGGTSTYYHNPFWAEFAEIMYARLLELDLDEFGIVGSFNYRVTRQTALPSILVEMAFMSHAGDEEKLASEEFRHSMAEKILLGIIDYVSYMNKR